MGLDCYVLGKPLLGGRIGSYGSVHILRKIYVKMAIIYLKIIIKGEFKNTYFILINKILENYDDSSYKLSLKDDDINDKFYTIKKAFKNNLITDKIFHYISESYENAYINIKLHFQSGFFNELLMYENYFDTIQLLLIIEKWICDDNSDDNKSHIISDLDYSKIENDMEIDKGDDYLLFSKLKLIGLYKFVSHDDGAGCFSLGDCLDVYVSLNILNQCIRCLDLENLNINENMEHIIEWCEDVTQYFKNAVDHESILIFC